jgi:hypothetical protein
MYRGDMGEYFEEGALVGVLTTQPLDRVLDYRAPEGGCWLGAFVEVPLGPRKVLGVVWGPGKGDYDLAKIAGGEPGAGRGPDARRDARFPDAAGAYTLTPMPAMLRLATRVAGAERSAVDAQGLPAGAGRARPMTDARAAKVIETLVEYGGLASPCRNCPSLPGVSTSVIKGLAAQGVVEEDDTRATRPFCRSTRTGRARTLTRIRRRRRGPVRGDPDRSVWNDASEGRHRIGQDRGLSGGRGGVPARRAAGAGAAAGDRADGGVPDAGRGALRRAARRMAFGRDHDRAAALLEDAGAGRGAACRRRALGAVPAVPRSRPDRRR